MVVAYRKKLLNKKNNSIFYLDQSDSNDFMISRTNCTSKMFALLHLEIFEFLENCKDIYS